MEFCHIIPPIRELLDKLPRKYMIVAPLSDREIRFWKSVKGYKILDNGAWEGKQVDVDELMRLAREIDAREVVLPDKVGDCDKTIEMVNQYHDMFKGYVTMGVIQGRNVNELIRCYEAIKHVDIIGIPKYIGFVNRLEMIEMIDKPVHLLGLNCVGELERYVYFKKVRSIDSKIAIKAARSGIDLSKYSRWETVPDRNGKLDIKLALKNMRLLDQICGS